MANSKFRELARAKIRPQCSLVISQFQGKEFTIAQQLEVRENNIKHSVSLKGAFHVDDIDGLYNLRDALNIAIKKIEENN